MAGGSPDDIRAHVESIAARSPRDVETLTDRLNGRSWPGGATDRSEPAALAWVRRWRASGSTPPPLFCGCAQGRCLLCN